mmetsp:Transcript_22828/g.74343  ORF Transcript_22828/g.74343 Transcript_22828/m.74343 type:complete len:283 (+) Transcript_22828:44-892(+)
MNVARGYPISLFDAHEDVPRAAEKRHIREFSVAKLVVRLLEHFLKLGEVLRVEVDVVGGEDLGPEGAHPRELRLVHRKVADRQRSPGLEQPFGVGEGVFPVRDHRERIGDGDQVAGPSLGKAFEVRVSGVAEDDADVGPPALLLALLRLLCEARREVHERHRLEFAHLLVEKLEVGACAAPEVHPRRPFPRRERVHHRRSAVQHPVPVPVVEVSLARVEALQLILVCRARDVAEKHRLEHLEVGPYRGRRHEGFCLQPLARHLDQTKVFRRCADNRSTGHST